MYKRKFPTEAPCIRCGEPFTKTNHLNVACVPCRAIRNKEKQQRSKEKQKEARKNADYVPRFISHDRQCRGNVRKWRAYMEKNPVYFRGLYPRASLAEGVKDIKAWI